MAMTTQELISMARDAERYRWLKKQGRKDMGDDFCNVGGVDVLMYCDFEGTANSMIGDEADAIIDAAMAMEAK